MRHSGKHSGRSTASVLVTCDVAEAPSNHRSRFRLTVEGSEYVDTRIVDHPAFRLVGHAARVPLTHHGINPHIQQHIAALSAEEHLHLKALGNTEPSGLLAVSDDLHPGCAEGSELTYLHGVAVSPDTPVPGGLDIIEVPAGSRNGLHQSAPGSEHGRHDLRG